MTTAQKLESALKLHQSGRLADAESLYRRILQLDPANAMAIQFLGVLAFQAGNTAAAFELLQRAINIDPNCAAFHSNLAVVLKELGRFDDAIAACHRAIALAPDFADCHWNLSLCLLARGEFPQGWNEFEWRLRSAKLNLSRGLPQPQWNGQSLQGKTILLHTEGGFGDAFQFIRYLPLVQPRGGRVVLECQPELRHFFQKLRGVAEIIPRGSPLPPFDFQIPLQSLPRIFQTDLTNIPGPVPYLAAPPQIAEYWKSRLSDDISPKIGICWSGSNIPQERRSRSLDVFAPLAQIPGVVFHSLQRGPESAQPTPGGMNLVDHAYELADFADTAGLIANLDLVISVDTSIAHLAGAMAKPVWTLLPFVCDFRWLLGRADSPWYPTMRLFRQQKPGDWSTPVATMVESLRALAQK